MFTYVLVVHIIIHKMFVDMLEKIGLSFHFNSSPAPYVDRNKKVVMMRYVLTLRRVC